MGPGAGGNSDDPWNELVSDVQGCMKKPVYQAIYYRRRVTRENHGVNQMQLNPSNENHVIVAAGHKRISWNRSLSTRGRISITVAACAGNQPQKKQIKRKGKPNIPKGKGVKPLNFEKERQYFHEVDAFELLEESPSPKTLGTWSVGNEFLSGTMPHVSSRLEKWLICKKLNHSFDPSSTLSKILETPSLTLRPICTTNLRTPERAPQVDSSQHSVQGTINAYLLSRNVFKRDHQYSEKLQSKEPLAILHAEDNKNVEDAIRKLSLSSSDSLHTGYVDPLTALLAVCGQSVPSTLLDVFSRYCGSEDIVKVGEGTYGEVFKANNTVCKIVPFDGDFRVNGETQKKSDELLEEVILCRTLNHLRETTGAAFNSCSMFIETLDLRVCQGAYGCPLIRAWEDWDEKHGSENDHPKEFPEKQLYMLFVLQHGGVDLESFVLENFEEAKGLLIQVTAALAVAEAAYEFEHRDLHWGNILLCRDDSTSLQFILEGKPIVIRTHGVLISVIDFTLSRINTGEDILFLDLSADPDLFKGPKGDKQADTYRKMKELTDDFWEGSFPRTNVLWLHYLVDTLLVKKSFERSSKNERDMRSLKKRLDKYNSSKEALSDPFFNDMFLDSGQSLAVQERS